MKINGGSWLKKILRQTATTEASIHIPIELGRSCAVGGTTREEGSPAPVIDDIIGGLVPNFWCEMLQTMGRPGYEASKETYPPIRALEAIPRVAILQIEKKQQLIIEPTTCY